MNHCHTLEPSCLLRTAWPYSLFIENIGKRPIIFFFMPNSANNLPYLVYPWGMLDLSVPWFHLWLLSPYLIATPRLCHQEITALLNLWLSVPLVLLIWLFFYFVDFPNLLKLLLFLLFPYLLSICCLLFLLYPGRISCFMTFASDLCPQLNLFLSFICWF